jgi:hypothetical protein
MMLRCSWCSEILVGLGALVVGCRSSSNAPDAAAEPAPAPTSSAAASAAPSAPMPPPASASAVEIGMRSRDAGREADAGPDYEAGECPDFEPSRWEPFLGLDLQSRCWLFVPAKADKLPEPIVWEPCGRAELGPGCRKMKAAKGQRFYVDNTNFYDFRAVHAPASGPVRVQMVRSCERQRSRIHVIAVADGPVLSAMADDSEPYHCDFHPALQPEGWAARLTNPDPKESENTDPNVQFPRVELGLAAGRGELTPRKLDAPPAAVSLTEPKGVDAYRNGPGRQTLEVLGALGTTPGTKPVLVGSDGSDLVWSRPIAEKSPDCEVYRAPWNEDPSQLGPVTRVLGARCKNVNQPWKVGCGYAATTTVEDKALLVRLNDGTSYTFPTLCGPLDWSSSCPTRVLALTCKEIFLAIGGPNPNVARVAYGGLPTGVPAPEPPRQAGGAADAGADGGSASRDGGAP